MRPLLALFAKLALPCLAVVLLAPGAAADDLGDVLPEHVEAGVPDPTGPPDDAVESGPLDALLDQLNKMVEVRGVRVGLDYETAPKASVECEVDPDGQMQCRSFVCLRDDAQGSEPVSTGDDTIGVGVDRDRNPDGSYGPYTGAYVSLSRQCGCLTWVQ